MEYFFTLEKDLPAGVGFRLWGKRHIEWLLIAAAAGVILCACYCRAGEGKKRALRRGVGFAVLLCELMKDANLAIQGAFSVYYLPLHLCGLAVFFVFFHSLRPGETVGNFLYSCCMPGAVFALLFPDWTMFPAFSYHSAVAFAVHMLLAVYPLMLVLGGTFRPSARFLPRCFAILAALAGAVYVFDRVFSANYLFLLAPAAGSPLEWFASFLGNPGYLLGYIPMLALVWALLYLPFRGRRRRESEG